MTEIVHVVVPTAAPNPNVAAVATTRYSIRTQERFALDTRLHPATG
jgi:hypothetical protein